MQRTPDRMTLSELKREAQRHYAERLFWTDTPEFGGSAWADVDHHTVSVMVDPPPGNPHICAIRGGKQEPLPTPTAQLAQLAF